MKLEWIGLRGALTFTAVLAGIACSDYSDDGDDAASSAGSGGGGAAAPVAPNSCTKTAGGTEVTGLCAAAALNTLTAADATQLCTDTGAFVVSGISKAPGCRYAGIIAAASSSAPTQEQLQAACSTREGTCMQGAASMGPGGNTLCGQIPATCTMTVEQYSTCVKDEVALFDQGASALVSCSMLTFGNLNDIYNVPMDASGVASCAAIKTACPNFSIPYID